jgi:hypothetical protein
MTQHVNKYKNNNVMYCVEKKVCTYKHHFIRLFKLETVDHKKINVIMILTSFCNAELTNCKP